MPTYAYCCKLCKHEFDKIQRITADALVECPECNEDSLKRLIGSGGSVIFKGNGFFCTDYRDPPKLD